MANKTPENSLPPSRERISALKERIESKLVTRGISKPSLASDEQIYHATVAVLKESMIDYRASFKKRKN